VRSWRRAAEAAAVTAVLAFVAAYLAANWREVRAYPWELDPGPLAGATGLALLALVLSGGLWAALLRGMGEEVSWREALAVWFLASLARYVPGKVWHISGMAYLARRKGLQAVHAVGASLLVQGLVLVTGTLILIATLPAEIAAASGLGVEIGLGLAAAALAALYLSPIFDTAYAKSVALLGQPAPPERLSIRQKLLFGVGAALAWGLYGAAFWLFVEGATGRTLPFAAAVGICVAGYLAGFLAFFTPGGLGVREGLYALLLGAYLPASVALAVALFHRLWLTSIELALAGGSAALGGRGESPLAGAADARARSDG